MCLLNVGKQEQQTCFETDCYKIFDMIVHLLFFSFFATPYFDHLFFRDMAVLPVALSLSFILSDNHDIYFHESSAGDVIFLQSIRTNPCHLHATHMKPLGRPETTSQSPRTHHNTHDS